MGAQVVPLKYASAEALANTLNRFADAVAGAGGSGPGVAIVPDPRTNSLLIQAPPEKLPAVLDLVRKLDVKAG